MQIDFSSIIKKLGLLNDDIEIFYNLNFINTKIEFKKSKILVILRDHMSTDDIFLPIDLKLSIIFIIKLFLELIKAKFSIIFV